MSTVAGDVDWLYYFIYWLSVVLFVAIVGAMLYWAIKYRERQGHKAEPTGHNMPLEIAWTVAPIFILVFLFHKGFQGYMDMTVAPANSMEIHVNAKQWSWEFVYPNGGSSHRAARAGAQAGQARHGVGDVIHSFFVPALRVKRDVVPGMYTMRLVRGDARRARRHRRAPSTAAAAARARTGELPYQPSDDPRNPYPAGQATGHWAMHSMLYVETHEDYDKFLKSIGDKCEEYASEGQAVSGGPRGRAGPEALREQGLPRVPHDDRAPGVGPSWKGIWGKHEATNVGTVKVDENYIRESILDPQAKIVTGFRPGDADVPRPDLRPGDRRGHRLHQVAEVARERTEQRDRGATVMAAVDIPAGGHAEDAHGDPDANYLTAKRGIWSWLLTLDHKRIGLMYLTMVSLAFLAGGIFALLVRLELFSRGKTIIDAETYNRFFTLHGAVMVFLFIIPSVPAALGNFFLPIMIGAKDVAFPRLNLLSFYIYLVGAAFVLASIIIGAVDTGWTFYTPYSLQTANSVISMTLGVFVLGFSSILTGLNFLVTVHTMRAPGVTWTRLPLFVWGMYATALIQVLATPVLAITLLLLCAERFFGIGIFDPKLGGDPVLFQHFFWFYSHPAVYIMIVPGMAINSELIATFSRRAIFGYFAVAMSSIGLALLGFLVWGHHMFVAGMSEFATMLFSALTFLVAIPSGVKVFNWTATIYKGSIRLGIADALRDGLHLPLHHRRPDGPLPRNAERRRAPDRHVLRRRPLPLRHDGRHRHRLPRRPPLLVAEDDREDARRAEGQDRLRASSSSASTSRSCPQFIMGSRGMPRRYYDYLPQFEPFHQASTIGSWILGDGSLHHGVHAARGALERQEGAAQPVGLGRATSG